MDSFILLSLVLIVTVLTLGLLVSIDFRAAVFGIWGVHPLLGPHSGSDIFDLDLAFASFADLEGEYQNWLAHIKTRSPFPQLDNARLALAYARAVSKLTEREVLSRLAVRPKG